MEIVLAGGGWTSPPVVVAAGFVRRLVGLGARGRRAMLFPTRSVHGLTIGAALTVIALDAAGIVRSIHRLRPGRILSVPGASWLLELTEPVTLPPVGTRLAAIRCPGRTAA